MAGFGGVQSTIVSAGSNITFHWDSTGGSPHNIFEFPDATAFGTCDFTEATSITSEVVFVGEEPVAFPSAGVRYFACQVGSHCKDGQKLAVEVINGPAPPPPPTPTHNHDDHDHGHGHGDGDGDGDGDKNTDTTATASGSTPVVGALALAAAAVMAF